MSEEFRNYTARVTRGEDGVYRWYYDMDMHGNKSMLYMLEKINLFTFLGVSIGGALLIMAVEGDAAFARGILVIGLVLCALMALLFWIGFYVFSAAKRGNYRIHYAMREDGIELVWSNRVKESSALAGKALGLTGAVIGSRTVRGRWRPTLDEVSRVSFSDVIRCKRYPKWNMLDLSMLGGKFQVYSVSEDFDWVENYILERAPRARR